jgi:hypothetical protein
MTGTFPIFSEKPRIEFEILPRFFRLREIHKTQKTHIFGSHTKKSGL